MAHNPFNIILEFMKTYIVVVVVTGMLLLSGCNQANSKKKISEPTENVTEKTPLTKQVIPVSKTDSVAVTKSINVPDPVQTSASINPPHGQPGHDCAIPVGSSMNSPRVTKPAANTPVVNPNIFKSAQTAPGMNPPHGQPGHDCAIAVGAPLKK